MQMLKALLVGAAVLWVGASCAKESSTSSSSAERPDSNKVVVQRSSEAMPVGEDEMDRLPQARIMDNFESFVAARMVSKLSQAPAPPWQGLKPSLESVIQG